MEVRPRPAEVDTDDHHQDLQGAYYIDVIFLNRAQAEYAMQYEKPLARMWMRGEDAEATANYWNYSSHVDSARTGNTSRKQLLHGKF